LIGSSNWDYNANTSKTTAQTFVMNLDKNFNMIGQILYIENISQTGVNPDITYPIFASYIKNENCGYNEIMILGVSLTNTSTYLDFATKIKFISDHCIKYNMRQSNRKEKSKSRDLLMKTKKDNESRQSSKESSKEISKESSKEISKESSKGSLTKNKKLEHHHDENVDDLICELKNKEISFLDKIIYFIIRLVSIATMPIHIMKLITVFISFILKTLIKKIKSLLKCFKSCKNEDCSTDHKSKNHKSKDYKSKDHKSKDHKSKDHKSKDHKSKDHKSKDNNCNNDECDNKDKTHHCQYKCDPYNDPRNHPYYDPFYNTNNELSSDPNPSIDSSSSSDSDLLGIGEPTTTLPFNSTTEFMTTLN
jgi:hypothetical protein